jgi:NAD(P)-dependent dehydrogenase (short-subunit alcohol dehydrogenase family)
MKAYLITGAGRGIGRALTEELLRRGDRVLAASRTGVSPFAHPALRPLAFDVRDASAVAAAAAACDEPIDVLINNAGIMGPRDDSSLGVDLDAFAEVLAVNVLGPLRVLNAFLPHLRRAAGAKVVAVSSQLGGSTFPGSGRVAYRTSKAALNRAMQCVAADLAREGIAAVTMHPGWVRTDMGGPDGEISPEESARGVLGVVDALTLATTGRFLDWNGAPRPW